jgi:pre-rRNA-processing protein TSR4
MMLMAIQLTGPSAPNSSGLGSQIFGSAPAHDTIPTEASVGAVEDDISEEETDGDIESDLVEALQLTTLDDSSQWTTAPAYPPLYLSTASEYLPSSPKLKPVHIDDPLADGDKKNKESLSFLEAYENSLNIDEVFSRFTKRVGYEGQQCIRFGYFLLNGLYKLKLH